MRWRWRLVWWDLPSIDKEEKGARARISMAASRSNSALQPGPERTDAAVRPELIVDVPPSVGEHHAMEHSGSRKFRRQLKVFDYNPNHFHWRTLKFEIIKKAQITCRMFV